jgi:DNA-binding MarR family transcriptional regulator
MDRQDRDWQEDLSRLYRAPGHLLRRANQAVVALFNARCHDSGLTPVQYAAMTAIAAEGKTDATRLSEAIGFDRATLGSVIDRLERRGLVTRKAHPGDRRMKLVALTDTGRDALHRVQPLVEQSHRDFLEPLTREEAETLLRLLTKLLRHHDEPKG